MISSVSNFQMILNDILFKLTYKIFLSHYHQGISPIAKIEIAIAISILIKFGIAIAIAISIAILKKIADCDRDRSFVIADRDHFTYC